MKLLLKSLKDSSFAKLSAFTSKSYFLGLARTMKETWWTEWLKVNLGRKIKKFIFHIAISLKKSLHIHYRWTKRKKKISNTLNPTIPSHPEQFLKSKLSSYILYRLIVIKLIFVPFVWLYLINVSFIWFYPSKLFSVVKHWSSGT